MSRLRLLAWSESIANLVAWRIVVVPAASGILVLSAALTYQTARQADDAAALAEHLDAQGRHVLQLTAQGTGQISTRLCDSLQSIDGVTSTLAITGGPRVRLANGDAAQIQYVTAGATRYLPISHRAPVLVGSSRVEQSGLVAGAWMRVSSGPHVSESATSVRVATIDATPRTTNIDDALLIVMPPSSSPADVCWVETVEGSTATVGSAIGNMAYDGTPIAVAPLRADLVARSDPELVLRGLPGDLTTWVVGIAALVVLLGWWYIRRQEWALYRSLGFPTGRLAAIACLEWLAIIATPIVAGAAWGLALAGTDLHEVAYSVAVVNAAAVLLVAATAPGIWTAWIRLVAVARVLRGT